MTTRVSDDQTGVDLVLASFPWLTSIPGILDILLDGVLDELPDAIILSDIRSSSEYATRFPGMASRRTKGFNPINEAEYLQLEDDYRSLLRGYGVLGTFDTPGENSFQRMLDDGFAAMRDAAPTVQEAFMEFYGIEVDESTLLTYFLDEDLGISEIERQIATATVGGAAYQYGLNITRARSELLTSQGVTEDLAREGFANVARETPQLETLARLHSLEPLEQMDLENLFFHSDPDIIRRRRRIFDTALADFQGPVATNVTRRGALGELVDLDQSV